MHSKMDGEFDEVYASQFIIIKIDAERAGQKETWGDEG
jgi:hypothetical protein